jgi:putative DNA primase/helicase
LAFIDDDVDSRTRLPDGQLKRLSEAKTVTGENKFGPSFTFTVHTVPILLCNNPPSLADLSKGMLRRLVVVPFDRTFAEDEEDRHLFPRIWASELPGILNHFLAGLRRVIQRGWHLAPPKAVKAAKEEWLKAANPLSTFIDACCVQEGTCWLDDLYKALRHGPRRQGLRFRSRS